MIKNFDIGFILFAYNEEKNLTILLEQIIDTLKFNKKIKKVFISICIQGKYESVKEVEDLKYKYSKELNFNISYIYFKQPLGIKKAFQKAYENLPKNLENYITMDCDLNHDPRDLNKLLEKFSEGFDIVIGSRYCEGGKIVGMPYWKKTLSILFNKFISIILKFPVIDKTSGFRIIKHKELNKVIQNTNSNGFPFYSEFLMILKNQDKRIIEVPIIFKKRVIGVSKMRIMKTIFDYLYLFYLIIFKIKN